jgi:hypothetical protein
MKIQNLTYRCFKVQGNFVMPKFVKIFHNMEDLKSTRYPNQTLVSNQAISFARW